VNADERRAGLIRLSIVVGALVVASLVVAAGFGLAGATFTDALGAGTGVIGILLVVVAMGAFVKANPMSRHHVGEGRLQMSASDARRDTERFALGMFVLGIAFLLTAMSLG
jgi:hypothetical protein